MAKVEEFILYSLVVFNVTLADGDEAHKSSLTFKVTSSGIGGFGSLF